MFNPTVICRPVRALQDNPSTHRDILKKSLALQHLDWRMQALNEKSKTDLDIAPIFYGVGNHSGGPTIK